jgi:hypothetical protein
LEQPELLLALYFHPNYRSIGLMLPLSEYLIKKFVNGYASRWGSAAACSTEENISTSSAIADWALGVAPWVREAVEFHGNPCNFWAQMARVHKLEETLDAKTLRVLGEVCRKLFSCSQNSADPESLFSELGRIVSTDRTQQCDELIEMKHVIAADVRASKTISEIRLGKTKGYVRSRKRFSEEPAATLILKAMDRSTEGASGALSMVAQAQTLSVRDIVPMEAEVVHVGVSSIASETLHAGCLAANTGSPGTSNSSITNVASNIGIIEDNYETETETDDLSGFRTGIEYH